MNSRLCVLPVAILVIAVCHVVALAQTTQPATQPARRIVVRPTKTVPVGQVVSALAKEGGDAWYAGKAWPRDKTNYGSENSVAVKNEELIRVLSVRLHSVSSVDGYIKWQLMGFAPDLSQVDLATAKRIIAVMPELLPQMEPRFPAAAPPAPGMNIAAEQTFTGGSPYNTGYYGGRYTPRLGVINAGTVLKVGGAISGDGRYVTLNVEAAQSDLITIRQITVSSNLPSATYRTALIDALPVGQGFRIAGMLADIKHRVVKGDSGYVAAVEKFVKECEENGAVTDIHNDLRKKIIGALYELGNLKTTVTSKITKNDKDQPVIEKEQYFVKPELLARAARALDLQRDMGTMPGVEPKSPSEATPPGQWD